MGIYKKKLFIGLLLGHVSLCYGEIHHKTMPVSQRPVVHQAPPAKPYAHTAATVMASMQQSALKSTTHLEGVLSNPLGSDGYTFHRNMLHAQHAEEPDQGHLHQYHAHLYQQIEEHQPGDANHPLHRLLDSHLHSLRSAEAGSTEHKDHLALAKATHEMMQARKMEPMTSHALQLNQALVEHHATALSEAKMAQEENETAEHREALIKLMPHISEKQATDIIGRHALQGSVAKDSDGEPDIEKQMHHAGIASVIIAHKLGPSGFERYTQQHAEHLDRLIVDKKQEQAQALQTQHAMIAGLVPRELSDAGKHKESRAAEAGYEIHTALQSHLAGLSDVENNKHESAASVAQRSILDASIKTAAKFSEEAHTEQHDAEYKKAAEAAGKSYSLDDALQQQHAAAGRLTSLPDHAHEDFARKKITNTVDMILARTVEGTTRTQRREHSNAAHEMNALARSYALAIKDNPQPGMQAAHEQVSAFHEATSIAIAPGRFGRHLGTNTLGGSNAYDSNDLHALANHYEKHAEQHKDTFVGTELQRLASGIRAQAKPQQTKDALSSDESLRG